MPKLKALSKGLDHKQPPTLVFFEGHGEILESFVKEHAVDFKHSVCFIDRENVRLEANKFYFADFKLYFPVFYKRYAGVPSSFLCFGNVSLHSAKMIGEWKGVQLLVEDINEVQNKKHPLTPYSTDVVPATSFPYMSCRYLSSK